MPPNRHKLILDEQAFQGLLAAAFIVQEYSGRENVWLKYGRRNGDPPSSDWLSKVAPATESPDDPEPAEGSPGESGLDEFRPGERLQRNWASMWLLSKEKEKDARPIGSPETGGTQEDLSGPAAEGGSGFYPACDSDNSGLNPAGAEGEPIAAAMDEMTDQRTQEDFAHEGSDLPAATLQLSANDESLLIAGADESATTPGEIDEEASDEEGSGNRSLMRHLADLRVTLRFHRSNLYLGAAVFMAALALFWPTAGSPRRAALSPWERALVTLGLAEAPEPAVRLQGDPSIEVWIDPHTALYYCPGEELYGKTADGRLGSQREAQMDRFEPAGRSTCE
jgi:hypothetical protein